ncbi:unnamed protein product [Cyprideis torosa]|uniref:Uncharacterized protein n=1 Tax=Cyprideis torosa TaxID=163714 RepID=A0A7R8WF93_9CRUS|nr:unnamed protein product [Cyprideis torosa]CAG0891610.1 unnamed protein product [Cyprideis torosa]
MVADTILAPLTLIGVAGRHLQSEGRPDYDVYDWIRFSIAKGDRNGIPQSGVLYVEMEEPGIVTTFILDGSGIRDRFDRKYLFACLVFEFHFVNKNSNVLGFTPRLLKLIDFTPIASIVGFHGQKQTLRLGLAQELENQLLKSTGVHEERSTAPVILIDDGITQYNQQLIRDVFSRLGHHLSVRFKYSTRGHHTPATNAILGLTFAEYVLQPLFPECPNPDVAIRLLAAFAIGLFTFINCVSTKLTGTLSAVFMVGKVGALVVIIIAGFAWMFSGHYENYENPWAGTVQEPGKIAASFYAGIYSYAGWNYLNFVTEELKNPYRDLPRAIYISLPIITAIYVAANIAYFAVLAPFDMYASEAVAVWHPSDAVASGITPLAMASGITSIPDINLEHISDVLGHRNRLSSNFEIQRFSFQTFGSYILGRWAVVMPIFVAMSAFGSLCVHIQASSRLCFVGARDGMFPDCLSLINLDRKTPVPALVFLGILSLATLTSSDIMSLIVYASWIESLFILVSLSGMLWMRYKRPELKRPIKDPSQISSYDVLSKRLPGMPS